MANFASKPGFVAGLLAAVLLLELGAARLLFTADRERVTFAGTPFGSACYFKQHFGVPCPACGMTRSLVLTLHGDIAVAAELNPGGPVLVFGILYFSGAMLWLSLRQRALSTRDLAKAKRRIQWTTAIASAGLMAVVCAHWLREVVHGLVD